MKSARISVLKKLEVLVEESKLSRRDYLEIDKILSTQIGLSFERFESDVWQKHLNDGKHIFLKEHEKSHFFNPVAKTFGCLIEGDNLPALFLLENVYKLNSEKINLIYIDPPYNTGTGGFVYNNDYRIKNTDRGLCYVNNEDNFRHSKWLSMMEPRLKHAKNLLKDDGLIIVSIDDNEYCHLKLLLDQIFGINCYKGTIIWKKGAGIGCNYQKNIRKDHEYVLIYEKLEGRSCFNIFENNEVKKPKTRSIMKGGKRGEWRKNSTLWYSITDPKTKRPVWPCDKNNNKKLWAISYEKYKEELASGNIVWKADRNGRRTPHRWIIHKVPDSYLKSVIDAESVPGSGSGQGAINLTKDFLGKKDLFDYPKPINFLKHLFKHTMPKDGLILDFFAGSGTTACAISELNKEDNGERKFILITNNDGDDIKKLKKINNYCVFRDVLYERLKNNQKKYDLSCKVFMIDAKTMQKLQKNNETFATRKNSIVETGFCLLSILAMHLPLLKKEEFIKNNYCFEINGRKYGFFDSSLDINMRFAFRFKENLE